MMCDQEVSHPSFIGNHGVCILHTFEGRSDRCCCLRPALTATRRPRRMVNVTPKESGAVAPTMDARPAFSTGNSLCVSGAQL